MAVVGVGKSVDVEVGVKVGVLVTVSVKCGVSVGGGVGRFGRAGISDNFINRTIIRTPKREMIRTRNFLLIVLLFIVCRLVQRNS